MAATGAQPGLVHSPHLAVINQTMQRRYWPHADPIGQTIVLNHGVAAGNVWTLAAPGNDQHFRSLPWSATCQIRVSRST